MIEAVLVDLFFYCIKFIVGLYAVILGYGAVEVLKSAMKEHGPPYTRRGNPVYQCCQYVDFKVINYPVVFFPFFCTIEGRQLTTNKVITFNAFHFRFWRAEAPYDMQSLPN